MMALTPFIASSSFLLSSLLTSATTSTPIPESCLIHSSPTPATSGGIRQNNGTHARTSSFSVCFLEVWARVDGRRFRHLLFVRGARKDCGGANGRGWRTLAAAEDGNSLPLALEVLEVAPPDGGQVPVVGLHLEAAEASTPRPGEEKSDVALCRRIPRKT